MAAAVVGRDRELVDLVGIVEPAELDVAGGDGVEDRGDVPPGADATCTRLEHELLCWLDPVADCDAYLADQKLDVARTGALLDAYFTWPTEPTSTGTWSRIANYATLALPHRGADRLAITALWNAVRTTSCASHARLRDLVTLRKTIRIAGHDPSFAPSLARMIDETYELCERIGPM